MKTQSFDTHPETEHVLLSLIRQATISKKMWQVRSLSKTVIRLSYRALSRKYKDLNEQELDIKYISIHFGQEIADRLKKYLDTHKDEIS